MFLVVVTERDPRDEKEGERGGKQRNKPKSNWQCEESGNFKKDE